MKRKMLLETLKGKMLNTFIRHRVTDIVQYATIAKWKWAGHIA